MFKIHAPSAPWAFVRDAQQKRIDEKFNEIRKAGFLLYKTKLKAIIICFFHSIKNNAVSWVIREENLGFLVIDFESLKRLNIVFSHNRRNKIRIRDINKMAIYKHPKKSWNNLSSKV